MKRCVALGLLSVNYRYLAESEKHPIILPNDHDITTLLIRKMHLGPSMVDLPLSRAVYSGILNSECSKSRSSETVSNAGTLVPKTWSK